MKRFICLLSLILFFGQVSPLFAEDKVYQDSQAAQELSVIEGQLRQTVTTGDTTQYRQLAVEALEIRDRYAETTFYAAGQASVRAGFLYQQLGDYEKALEVFQWTAQRYGDRLDTIPDDTETDQYRSYMSRASAYHQAITMIPTLCFDLKQYLQAKQAFQFVIDEFERSAYAELGYVTGGYKNNLTAQEFAIADPKAQELYGWYRAGMACSHKPDCFILGVAEANEMATIMIYLIEALYEKGEKSNHEN